MEQVGIFTMLYQLAVRVWRLGPRLLDLLYSLQGGVVGELVFLWLICKFLPPIIDIIFNVCEKIGSMLRLFEK